MELSLYIDLLNSEISEEHNGLIVISGIFNGDINNGNTVYVAPAGSFHGYIKAKDLIISGIVQGSIEVNNLIIHSSGQLYYDKLIYKELVTKEGAIIAQQAISLDISKNNNVIKREPLPYSDKHVHFNSSF
ncbi:MAG: bactofilin family protein [Tepidanaerobacteraceae bacterium]